MEAIQTRKEGVFSLEMVISRDPAATSRASQGEIELALPPDEGSACPDMPKKGKRKVQGVPQSQTAALPRPQEEEETDKSKQLQTEQTYEKH